MWRKVLGWTTFDSCKFFIFHDREERQKNNEDAAAAREQRRKKDFQLG